MRLLYSPDRKDIQLESVLYALGDPVRLAIVKQLALEGELPCGAFDVAIAKSTLSHHFKILRDAGVLHCRKEGTQHMNSLRRDDLESRFPGLLDAILAAAERSSDPMAIATSSTESLEG